MSQEKAKTTKICPICGLRKPLSSFLINPITQAYSDICASCRNKIKKPRVSDDDEGGGGKQHQQIIGREEFLFDIEQQKVEHEAHAEEAKEYLEEQKEEELSETEQKEREEKIEKTEKDVVQDKKASHVESEVTEKPVESEAEKTLKETKEEPPPRTDKNQDTQTTKTTMATHTAATAAASLFQMTAPNAAQTTVNINTTSLTQSPMTITAGDHTNLSTPQIVAPANVSANPQLFLAKMIGMAVMATSPQSMRLIHQLEGKIEQLMSDSNQNANKGNENTLLEYAKTVFGSGGPSSGV